MKTKYNIILSLTITGVLFITSCKPDESPACGTASNTTVNFTTTDLSKVPYTGFDTLYFKDINGDTNIVVGGGKKYYYDIVNTTHGGPACPPDVTNYQAYKIEFKPIKGDLKFTCSQELTYRFVNIAKNYPAKFSMPFGTLGIKIYNSPDYSDSMMINGLKYNIVYRVFGYDIATGIKDTSYYLYINKDSGILMIKSLKENEEYTILKK